MRHAVSETTRCGQKLTKQTKHRELRKSKHRLICTDLMDRLMWHSPDVCRFKKINLTHALCHITLFTSVFLFYQPFTELRRHEPT